MRVASRKRSVNNKKRKTFSESEKVKAKAMRFEQQEQIVWTLDDARKELEPFHDQVAQFGFHFGICGGVIRSKESRKDLDLILLPLNLDMQHDIASVLCLLSERWGAPEIYTPKSQESNYGVRLVSTILWKFPLKLIDVFVVES